MNEVMEKFLKGEKLSNNEKHAIVKYAYRNLEDEIEGEWGRWYVWTDLVFKYNGDYYMVGYDRGLTECQENCYDESIPFKVKPVKKMIEVIEWEEVK